ncbi:MAG: Ni/Fe hydrogenase subunit alpha [Candidatus Thermofonsia Clade 1 bacterium]|uniref:Ni/Fe hydrogenase subunit alpha n=1 Tax=Candidatus Thermofonsia Clade 1 bacterium TaxID=2364210 RepID=A0A2M8NYK4_9CHLR|nr:MAG: Ni/Fe hydrogenase subunit alpha [Candidatus Thermofonsia Clade 1 bacterium]
MTREITINPVTRIEGHGKITIYLADDGSVADAKFHVTQLRGFEKFAEGRPFHEMPSLMARICGICPVSHLIASAKACDALLGVRIPPTAAALRRVMNLAQIAQSHALSFFYLSAPDLLLGMDSDPNQRNLFGMLAANPQLARDGVTLRQTGQQIIEILGGKRIHPGWLVPGGVTEPLTAEKRDKIFAMLPNAIAITQQAIHWFKSVIPRFSDEISVFANFPTLHMGLVDRRGNLETYDGYLRIVDADGNIVEDRMTPEDYLDLIEEAVEPHSFLKSPYYKPRGYPEGMFRVGPLSRLLVADQISTPLANAELQEFRQIPERQSSFYYHLARLIEILYAWEEIQRILNTPDILSEHVRAYAEPNAFEGIGISEAPRGTLMHHYKIDKNGLITYVNLVIATGHNNLAMNAGVKQVAQRYVHGDRLSEGMLNRVEAVIRTFDPCLSCSTHAIGQMPLHIQLVAPNGEVLDEIAR